MELPSLENAFSEFQETRKQIRDIYDRTVSAWTASVDRKDELKKKSWNMPRAEKRESELDSKALALRSLKNVEKLLQETPKVVIVGRANSGKSSLANAILGRRVLPMEHTPCTARVAIIRASSEIDTSCLRFTDADGKKVEKRALSDDQIEQALRDYAMPEHFVGRKTVETMPVEIFLANQPLLRYTDIVDSPGTHENEHLNAVVQSYVGDSLLKSLIYVIDGKDGLTSMIANDVRRIRNQLGRVPIMFVCTKVDMNEVSSSTDSQQTPDGPTATVYESCDEDDDDDANDGADGASFPILPAPTVPTLDPANSISVQEKVFLQLKTEQLIRETEDYVDSVEFQGVSVHRVWDALRSGTSGRYLKDFRRFEEKFGNFTSKSLRTHIVESFEALLNEQEKLIDIILAVAYAAHKRATVFMKEVELVIEEEKRIRREIRKAIASEKIKLVVSKVKAKFLETMPEEAKLIQIDEDLQNSKESRSAFLEEIKFYVIDKFSERLAKELAKQGPPPVESSTLVSRCLERFKSVSGDKLPPGSLTLARICNVVQTAYAKMPLRLKGKISFSFLDRFRIMITTFLSGSIEHDSELSENLKENVAMSFIRQIDSSKVAESFSQKLEEKIAEAHQDFCEAMSKVQADQKQCSLEAAELSTTAKLYDASSFASLHLKTQAMLEDVLFKSPTKKESLAAGQSGSSVYACNYSGKEQTHILKERSLNPGSNDYWPVSTYFARTMLDEEKEHTQRIIRVLFPQTSLTQSSFGKMWLVELKMESSLKRKFDEKERLPRPCRLEIAVGALHGLRYLHRTGICHANLKLSNVLLDERNSPRLSDLGMRNLNHEKRASLHQASFFVSPTLLKDESCIKTGVDIYAFGILLWYLIIGFETFSDPVAFPEVKSITGEMFFSRLRLENLRPEIDKAGEYKDFLNLCFNDGESIQYHVGSLSEKFLALMKQIS